MSASASTPFASMPGLAQEAEELAAPAADVEHRRGVAEVVDVGRWRSRTSAVEPRMRASKAK